MALEERAGFLPHASQSYPMRRIPARRNGPTPSPYTYIPSTDSVDCASNSAPYAMPCNMD
jgi:hypothetical protein